MSNGNVKLDEVVTLYDSLHKTPPGYTDEGYPMIRVTDIRRGFVDTSETKRVDYETFREFSKKHRPTIGDILFTRVGSYGNSCFVNRDEEMCLGQNTVCIAPVEDRLDPYYLYCCLNSEIVSAQIESFVGGASQPTISLRNIKAIEIPLPDLPTQRKIAGILSAYDDLIENNLRRIRLLEEMAQSLYREWFVHFRFPGHESTPLVDSPLGPIPEDWEVKAFNDAAEFINGFAFKPKHLGKSGIPIIKIKELKNGIVADTPRYDGDEIKEKYHITNGDLLFSWSAHLDAYIWNSGDGYLNQHLFNVVPETGLSRTFLYFALLDRMHEFRSRSQGTTMRHIKRSALSEVSFVLPSKNFRSHFEDTAIPALQKIENLVSRNRNLRQTRDLLLPKLLSP